MHHDKETERPTSHYMKQNMKELETAHGPFTSEVRIIKKTF